MQPTVASLTAPDCKCRRNHSVEPFDEPRHFDEHARLHVVGDEVVERVDLRQTSSRSKTSRAMMQAPHDVARLRVGFLHQPVHELAADAIHQRVGQMRGEDFAAAAGGAASVR